VIAKHLSSGVISLQASHFSVQLVGRVNCSIPPLAVFIAPHFMQNVRVSLVLLDKYLIVALALKL
jgi:hypothetical protein